MTSDLCSKLRITVAVAVAATAADCCSEPTSNEERVVHVVDVDVDALHQLQLGDGSLSNGPL